MSSQSINQQEILASLKVLVCMAMADGQLLEEEYNGLKEALEELPLLPEGVTVESLLNEPTQLDDILPQITSETARELIYQSAYTMAYIDGDCCPEEEELLKKIENTFSGFGLWEKEKRLVFLQNQATKTTIAKQVQQITDPTKREIEVDNLIRNACFLNAVFGTFPVPVVAIAFDLLIYYNQLELVQDIGERWGYDRAQMNADIKKAFFGSIGLTGTRIAVNSLAKLVPVFGSVVGATTAFASTWAIGKVANEYFASGCQIEAFRLREAFKKAKKEGESIYKENEAAIAAKKQELEPQMNALNEDLKAGRITEEEYQTKLKELA